MINLAKYEQAMNILTNIQFNALDVYEKVLVKKEQVDCPVVHRYGPGIYIREVYIPAGTFSIGHRQKKQHLNIMLKGKVLMLQEDNTITELIAPMIFVAPPGRKCGYIIEDMVWLNVYPTDEKNVETLENIFLDKTPVVANEIKRKQRIIDRGDFKKAIAEIGYTEELVKEQSENITDLIDFPYGGYEVMVSASDIHGKGLFATANISKGQYIAPARIDGKRTPAGRYTNHSVSPNAEMVKSGEDIYLVSTKEINGCKGGFMGDEITIDYRESYRLHVKEGQ